MQVRPFSYWYALEQIKRIWAIYEAILALDMRSEHTHYMISLLGLNAVRAILFRNIILINLKFYFKLVVFIIWLF